MLLSKSRRPLGQRRLGFLAAGPLLLLPLLLPLLLVLQAWSPLPTARAWCADDMESCPVSVDQLGPLLELKDAWGQTVDLTSWNEANDCYDWAYVYCDYDGYPVSLGFEQFGLTGSIPSALLSLTRLEVLNLWENELSGPIPADIGINLDYLRVVSLDSNNLVGSLPASMSNMQDLEKLTLYDNELSGTIPAWISRLSELTHLDLSYNVINGSIPLGMSRLANLQFLIMNYMAISGPITDIFSNLKSLQDLSMFNQMFTGSLPPSIGLCSNLTSLQITDSSISGTLPSSFGNLRRLAILMLYGNYISGSIPPSFGNLTSLMALDLSSNSLTGSVPTEIGNMDSLIYFVLSDNLLTGPVPTGKNGRWSAAFIGNTSYGTYGIARNYFTGSAAVHTAGAQRFCPQGQVGSFALTVFSNGSFSNFGTQAKNCLVFDDAVCASESQRRQLECIGFCGATLPAGVCGGSGTCFLNGTSQVPTCQCDAGFFQSTNWTISSLVDGTPVNITFPTCSSVRPPPAPARVVNGTFTAGLVSSLIQMTGLNPHNRYFSSNFTGTVANPAWNISKAVDWRSKGGRDYVGAIKSQGSCASCWAFSAVSAVEGAVGIVRNRTLRLSEQQLLDCTSGGNGCGGGWVGSALSYAVGITPTRGGIANSSAYPYTTAQGVCKATVQGNGAVAMFERVTLGGWMGLWLAVEKQPVIVNIASDARSFQTYAGGFVYNDPDCFASATVNHNVVVVGYNLLAAQPFWILRNSWGAQWGEQGYMRMAVAGGLGICGIHSLPPLYPIVKGTNACRPINPCGGGTCTVTARGNTCSCPTGFASVFNIDNVTQTCAPVSMCQLFEQNPCAVGTCLSTTPGRYTCLCPLGFVSGQRTDGTVTCLPGASSRTYTVQPNVTSCDLVAMAYGITVTTLRQLNPTLNCSRPLTVGVPLTVADPQLKPCSLPYTLNSVDTCDSVAALFRITRTALLALNRGLNCSRLFSGLQVCLERGGTFELPLCSSYYSVDQGDTCEYIYRSVARPPLAAADFFRINPGINCNHLIPRSGLQTPGQQVCLSATSPGALRCPCPTCVYTVKLGDTCATIRRLYFRNSPLLMLRYNRGFICLDFRLFIGLRLCKPPA